MNSKKILLPKIVKDQFNTQTCIPCAITTILEYYYKTDPLSVNFIYGFYENKKHKGLSFIQCCNFLKEYGTCLESYCPGIYEQPKAHNEFLKYKNNINIKNNYKIKDYKVYTELTILEIQKFIDNDKPLLGILRLPKNYFLNNDYILMYHNSILKSLSHSIIIYGYDNDGFLCRNSFGKDWGDNGNFKILYLDIFDILSFIIDIMI